DLVVDAPDVWGPEPDQANAVLRPFLGGEAAEPIEESGALPRHDVVFPQRVKHQKPSIQIPSRRSRMRPSQTYQIGLTINPFRIAGPRIIGLVGASTIKRPR